MFQYNTSPEAHCEKHRFWTQNSYTNNTHTYFPETHSQKYVYFIFHCYKSHYSTNTGWQTPRIHTNTAVLTWRTLWQCQPEDAAHWSPWLCLPLPPSGQVQHCNSMRRKKMRLRKRPQCLKQRKKKQHTAGCTKSKRECKKCSVRWTEKASVTIWTTAQKRKHHWQKGGEIE